LSKDELKDKYKGEGVPISNIEDVDFIWKGEKLADLIGKQHCYDYILAAHVIEHVPDFISFMQDCEKLLSTEGSLSLIIPDMRWCFDSLGEITTTGKILDAFDSQRTCPTRGQIFDSFANSCRLDDTISWGHERQGKLSLIHELEEAKDQWVKLSLEKSYIDVHCWHFIPESFDKLHNYQPTYDSRV
jgi:hypothetical protein